MRWRGFGAAARILAVCALVLAIAATPAARGQSPVPERPGEPLVAPPADADVLRLEEVLASVQAHHPQLRAEVLAVRAARGEQLAARGAFDPELRVKGSLGPEGYYDYQHLDANISQLTPFWGAALYAGYRVQRETLPDYYGELETLSRGEVRAGVQVPLWKDRGIDGARAARAQANAGLVEAERQRDATLYDLWQGGAVAYFKWSAAYRELAVQRRLLDLARTRVGQIGAKVESGALAPIEALDNERALLSREADLIDAQRKLEQAGVKLSLFLRDDQGDMRLPVDVVPPGLTVPELPEGFAERETIEAALETHPALRALEAELEQARTALALADNAVAPDLDVGGEVSKDFGTGDPEALETLSPLAVRVGATLKLPLALRKARGKRAAQAAKVEAVETKLGFLRDKLRSSVWMAASALRNALERAERTSRAAEVAEQLAAGERTRFELGATTLIWVTLREKTAADAEIKAIHALAAAHIARADYLVALARRPR